MRNHHSALHKLMALGVAGLILAATVTVAGAHSHLMRSEPGNADALATAPTTVSAWFDETPSPTVSKLEVFDEALNQVDLKDTTSPASDPNQLIVHVQPNLPNGTYTVRWTALSAVDGHLTSGIFVFGVGGAPGVSSVTDAQDGAGNLREVIIRWLNLLSLTALGGALMCSVLVLWPALAPARFPAPIVRRVIKDAIFFAALGVICDLGNAMYSAKITNPVAFLTGRYGLVLGLRLGLLAVTFAWLAAWRIERRWYRWGGVLLASGLLFTMSANSHSAASPLWPTISLLADWAHLMAVGVWIGGLLILALTMGKLLSVERRPILVRFSAYATLSVAVLALTGLYSSALQIQQLQDLWETDYGRVLLFKLALVSIILLLGLFNKRALRNPTSQATLKAQQNIERRVMIEASLGIAILLTVGVLSATPPPKPPSGPLDRSMTQLQSQSNITARFSITPNIAGNNHYTIAAFDDGKPILAARRVRARFVLPAINLESAWVTLKPDGTGTYMGEGSELSAVGDWRIQLDVLIDNDHENVRLLYPWQMSSAQLGRVSASPGPMNTVALGLLSMGVVLLFGSWGLNRVKRYGKTGERVLLGGIGAILVAWIAVSVIANARQPGQISAPGANPVPADMTSIIAGQTIFKQYCIACHGPQGLGDGPQAASLAVPPANLRTHITQHTDTALYGIVANGIGAMPPVGAAMTDEQRWNLVNYLRTMDEEVFNKK